MKKEIKQLFESARKDGLAKQNEVFGNIPIHKRLEIVQWVFRCIDEHIQEGGTYRFLIYERLGFGPEAYCALYPWGMNISNAACEIEDKINDKKRTA